MHEKKFDVKKLHKLNNPERLKDIPPPALKKAVEQHGVRELEKRILVDIGAGTGFFTKALVSQWNLKKAYALDTAPTMIDWIQKHLGKEFTQIEPLLMSEAGIPLADRVADIVSMLNVQHELDEPAPLMGEIMRILAPDGVLLIVDWLRVEMPQGPPIAIRWEEEDVVDLLKKQGFAQVTVHDKLEKHFVITALKSSDSANI